MFLRTLNNILNSRTAAKMSQPNKTINQVLLDKSLLGAALGNPKTFNIWLAVFQAAFGLELDDEQQKIFAEVAGGRKPPTKRVREPWCVVGRRGGKSRMAAALAVYIALFCKHKLAPGEVGMVLILVASVSQSKTVFGYEGVLEQESGAAQGSRQRYQGRNHAQERHRHFKPRQFIQNCRSEER